MATSLTKNKKRSKRKSHLSQIEVAKSLIQPVADIKDYMVMLVYAKGGKGKTTFAASSGLKTIIIDFNEKGTISIKNRPNVFVYRITHWTQLDDIYWFLKSGKHDFEVAVLDTVSSMAKVGIKWVLGDDATRDANRDPLMPDKRTWGKLAVLLETSFSNWRNLDMHVIFNAHERETVSDSEEEEDVVTIETHPALSPAPREALINMVHVVGRLYKKEVTSKKKGEPPKKKFEWRMLVGDDDRYVTKLRQDPTSKVLIPRVVRNPTLKYFIETILPELETNKEQD